MGIIDDLTRILGDVQHLTVEGEQGAVTVIDGGEVVVLQRHGLDSYTPAHRIDHAANLSALTMLGCDRVLAMSSVGSLRVEIPVATIVVPDDFVALEAPPTSVHHDARSHIVPGFAPEWRTRVLGTWREHDHGEVIDGGVYWQTNGPRFETPAEVGYLAAHADLVGMTVGSECIVACELGIAYAAICVVDNLANGLGDSLLTREAFEAGKAANSARVLRTLAEVLPVLA